jgi:hypothetical protein
MPVVGSMHLMKHLCIELTLETHTVLIETATCVSYRDED